MNVGRLVEMANDIGQFYALETEGAAAEGIAQHLQRFWAPQMRAQIIAHVQNDGSGVSNSVCAAVRLLEKSSDQSHSSSHKVT